MTLAACRVPVIALRATPIAKVALAMVRGNRPLLTDGIMFLLYDVAFDSARGNSRPLCACGCSRRGGTRGRLTVLSPHDRLQTLAGKTSFPRAAELLRIRERFRSFSLF